MRRNYSPIRLFMSIGHKTKANYILKSATVIAELTATQREAAKKAIEWLVSKAAHTIEEIAEHFDVTSELVELIVDLLKEEKRVYIYKDQKGLKMVSKEPPNQGRGK
jgi:predicted HTH transcriptional regulator